MYWNEASNDKKTRIYQNIIFNALVLYFCATLFRALRTAAGGDGMQKKDTEIPPERAFV
jgi:hypothetical protein